MKAWIHKKLAGKEKYSFRKADLIENVIELKNPARGWYRLYPFYLETEPDFESVSLSIPKDDVLALVILDIGAFREEALDEQVLMRVRRILNFFVEKELEIILRITYDHEGNALEREPFFFAQVKEHFEQLMPIVREFGKDIFVIQGMFIGNWGEMHTSRFLAPMKLREMWSMLQKAGNKVFFAVRRPVHWRILHPEECGRMKLPCDKMGLFDDAIFGSDSHLGTFGTGPKEIAGWDGMWNREDELAFEKALCVHVPNGGEVVCGEQNLQNSSVEHTIETLSRMHVTYLNKDYDRKILDLWAEWKWEADSIWQNMSVYDYIGNHLGYRFWIKDVTVTKPGKENENLLVSIHVKNVGFANMYQEAEVLLEWEDEVTGDTGIKKLSTDMRSWNSQATTTLTCEIKQKDCSLYLSAKRVKDGKSIYFANNVCSEGRVLLGHIRRRNERVGLLDN